MATSLNVNFQRRNLTEMDIDSSNMVIDKKISLICMNSPCCKLNCVDFSMDKEINRLETFKYWPLSFISPKELAKNGFYYIGVRDRVRCHFCRIGLELWQRTDDVMSEHRRTSPDCRFIQGYKTKNVPID